MKELQDYGLHHVGFVVKDLDATIAQLESVYNVKVPAAYNFSPTRAWSYGEEVFDYELKITMVQLGSGSLLELIQPVSGNGVHRDFVSAGNNGLHHICFCVNDYDYWHTHFKNEKHSFIFESETEDAVNGYRRCFYAEDKILGTIYEIKETPYFRK